MPNSGTCSTVLKYVLAHLSILLDHKTSDKSLHCVQELCPRSGSLLDLWLHPQLHLSSHIGFYPGPQCAKEIHDSSICACCFFALVVLLQVSASSFHLNPSALFQRSLPSETFSDQFSSVHFCFLLVNPAPQHVLLLCHALQVSTSHITNTHWISFIFLVVRLFPPKGRSTKPVPWNSTLLKDIFLKFPWQAGQWETQNQRSWCIASRESLEDLDRRSNEVGGALNKTQD